MPELKLKKAENFRAVATERALSKDSETEKNKLVTSNLNISPDVKTKKLRDAIKFTLKSNKTESLTASKLNRVGNRKKLSRKQTYTHKKNINTSDEDGPAEITEQLIECSKSHTGSESIE